jgi:hypothetical protein
MNNFPWIYRDSPKGLHRMDYCNKVDGFITCALSNLKNISGGGIRCPSKRCKNKKVSQSKYCNDVFST